MMLTPLLLLPMRMLTPLRSSTETGIATTREDTFHTLTVTQPTPRVTIRFTTLSTRPTMMRMMMTMMSTMVTTMTIQS